MQPLQPYMDLPLAARLVTIGRPHSRRTIVTGGGLFCCPCKEANVNKELAGFLGFLMAFLWISCVFVHVVLIFYFLRFSYCFRMGFMWRSLPFPKIPVVFVWDFSEFRMVFVAISCNFPVVVLLPPLPGRH